eukprot:30835-Pelagococcus_subviridis.AAC.4
MMRNSASTASSCRRYRSAVYVTDEDYGVFVIVTTRPPRLPRLGGVASVHLHPAALDRPAAAGRADVHAKLLQHVIRLHLADE